jgi:uncharacterized protein (DUF362 family)
MDMPFSKRGGQVAVQWGTPWNFRDLCESTLPLITDLNWLSRGDSVFIKVACNSGHDHPAVTSPLAVEALVAFFRERGAGRIWVGDQSGAQDVRLTQSGRKGSTYALMKRNGLWDAIKNSGAHPWLFDDQGWESYTKGHSENPHTWGNGLFVADVINQVDHVVNLNRLSTHALAGYTAGLKTAVGWLRDDSRGILHRDGNTFFERIADISVLSPLREKLRFNLTLADKALLNLGPDRGSVVKLGAPLAIASDNLLDHDSFVATLLPWLNKNDASLFDLYRPYPRHSAFFNRQFVRMTWGEEAAAAYTPIIGSPDTRALAYDVMRARYALQMGHRPAHIEVIGDGRRWPAGLQAHLKAAPDSFVFG